MRNGKITRQMTATGTVEYILKWPDFAVPGNFLLKPLLLLTLILTWAPPLFADEPLTFEKHVRPIFRQHCFDCHGATTEKEAGLDLRLVRLLVQGGESGAAITKGNAETSLLLQRVRRGEMPPGDHRVSEAQIKILERWIREGAATVRPEPKHIAPGVGITEEERAYWAFQPIRRPPLPVIKDISRARTPLDTFLLAKLEPLQLTFADDADKTTLLRRAYLDLIGLPPSPESLQRFLSDTSNSAWDTVINQLLDSPHYGERWGRHWLDVAGYADSEGYSNKDTLRAWAYKYRDWVIRAFNTDLPFDQFITWQLAGDELTELPHKNLTAVEIDQLIATGFLRMAVDGTGVANDEVARNRVVTDTLKIVSSALLGLSVGCAQCHDHRYDPISHNDYHHLRAIFEPALNTKNWLVPCRRRISLYTEAEIAKAREFEAEAQAKLIEKNAKQAEFMEAALQVELAKCDEPLRALLEEAYKTPADNRNKEQKAILATHPNIASMHPGILYQYNQEHSDIIKSMDAAIAAIRDKKPVEEFIRALTEQPGELPATHLFYRGDHRQPQHEVKPGGLSITAPVDAPIAIPDNAPDLPTSGRRLAYARWLTSPHHPLVSRVLVNRFWLHHFGKTFVSTADEFGKLGVLPTHPELLDWLAMEFTENGWSLKHLHRLIMTSTVYLQQSLRTPQADLVDGGNSLYSHFPVQRLDAEALRDSMLEISGRLDPTQFGNPVAVSVDEAGQTIIRGDQQRRSIYLQVRRTQPVALLKSFDAPVMEINCAVRQSSTVATQSLMLMNSQFILTTARAFTQRINDEAAGQIDSDLLVGFEFDVDKIKLLSRDPWSYGYGSLPEITTGETATVEFTPYPYFGDGAWRGGEKVPDEKIGYSLLKSSGGHPHGNTTQTIRRWTSPVTGTIRITGALAHPADAGDGVRLRIHSNQLGLQGSWEVHKSSLEYAVEFEVRKNDLIDTIVDQRNTPTNDSFANAFEIHLLDESGIVAKTWHTSKDFQGPTASKTFVINSPIAEQLAYGWQLAYGRTPTREEVELAVAFFREQLALLKSKNNETPVLHALTNYCQALLSSNQFLYVE